MQANPAIVFPASIGLLPPGRDRREPFLTASTPEDLERVWAYSGGHERRLWLELITAGYRLFFIYDADAFQSDAARDPSFDMIVFVGFNSLPCFFQSHLTVYACDDFTFGPDIAQHPSSVLCRQADVIVVAELRGPTVTEAIRQFATGSHVHSFSVLFSARKPRNIGQGRVLLFDDGYPVIRCNAVDSMSRHIAEHAELRPIALPPTRDGDRLVGQSPVYYEPTERHWPALIIPDRPEEATRVLEAAFADDHDYDLVLSATSWTLDVGKRPKPFVQVTFDCSRLELPKDPLMLPPAAFVRRRK
jgi:hypothetical protein